MIEDTSDRLLISVAELQELEAKNIGEVEENYRKFEDRMEFVDFGKTIR